MWQKIPPLFYCNYTRRRVSSFRNWKHEFSRIYFLLRNDFDALSAIFLLVSDICLVFFFFNIRDEKVCFLCGIREIRARIEITVIYYDAVLIIYYYCNLLYNFNYNISTIDTHYFRYRESFAMASSITERYARWRPQSFRSTWRNTRRQEGRQSSSTSFYQSRDMKKPIRLPVKIKPSYHRCDQFISIR